MWGVTGAQCGVHYTLLYIIMCGRRNSTGPLFPRNTSFRMCLAAGQVYWRLRPAAADPAAALTSADDVDRLQTGQKERNKKYRDVGTRFQVCSNFLLLLLL